MKHPVYPAQYVWLCVHCDLDNMTLGEVHNANLSHKKQFA